jgi:hypothetical protein
VPEESRDVNETYCTHMWDYWEIFIFIYRAYVEASAPKCRLFYVLTRKTFATYQSQSYSTTDGQLASLSWCQAPIWDLRPIFLLLSVFLACYGFVDVWAPSLARSLVCSFPLLGLTSAVFLRSEFHGTHEPIFETPPTWWARFLYLYPPGTG